MVVIDQKGTFRALVEKITESMPEEDVEYFDSRQSKLTNLVDYILYRTSLTLGRLSKVALRAGRNHAGRIYIFNDLSPETQYLIRRIGSSEVVYVEDGSAAYNDHYKSNGRLKKWVIKAFFRFYEEVHVLGTSSLVNRSLFSFPEIVRLENKRKPYSRLKLDAEKIYSMRRFFPQNPVVERASILILLPHTVELKKFIEVLRLHDSSAFGMGVEQIAVKRHPLDIQDGKLENEVESYLPAELLPAIYPDIKLVVGAGSTALQNIKFFFPNVIVKNVVWTESTPYDGKLEKMGVENLMLGQFCELAS